MGRMLSEDDTRDMIALEEQVKIVLERAEHEKIEGAVAVLALVRVARTILALYPPQVQAGLLEACIPFLRGAEARISDIYLT